MASRRDKISRDAMPDPRPESPAMRAALAAARARKGPPGPDDAPPLTVFPMTPGARAALDLASGKRQA